MIIREVELVKRKKKGFVRGSISWMSDMSPVAVGARSNQEATPRERRRRATQASFVRTASRERRAPRKGQTPKATLTHDDDEATCKTHFIAASDFSSDAIAASNSRHFSKAATTQSWSRPGSTAAGASNESLISSTTAQAALASEDVGPNSDDAFSAAATAAAAPGVSAGDAEDEDGSGVWANFDTCTLMESLFALEDAKIASGSAILFAYSRHSLLGLSASHSSASEGFVAAELSAPSISSTAAQAARASGEPTEKDLASATCVFVVILCRAVVDDVCVHASMRRRPPTRCCGRRPHMHHVTSRASARAAPARTRARSHR